jgi:hypothetical protein
MKSEVGQKLIKRHFIDNLPEELSLLEEQIENMNIEETSPVVKPFIFSNEPDLNSPYYEFRTPLTISPCMIEKFKQMFEETPKLTRKRLRL